MTKTQNNDVKTRNQNCGKRFSLRSELKHEKFIQFISDVLVFILKLRIWPRSTVWKKKCINYTHESIEKKKKKEKCVLYETRENTKSNDAVYFLTSYRGHAIFGVDSYVRSETELFLNRKIETQKVSKLCTRTRNLANR